MYNHHYSLAYMVESKRRDMVNEVKGLRTFGKKEKRFSASIVSFFWKNEHQAPNCCVIN